GVTKKGMLSGVNEKHKRGELQNISILFNGFQNKSQYGYMYQYGYGTYDESVRKNNFKGKILQWFKTKKWNS
ncbi:MAG TPA: hypothetical protein DDZ41_02645, partial [Flavobacterium sp.]|nr:hypothetical protein [Flavobacterium sp.]